MAVVGAPVLTGDAFAPAGDNTVQLMAGAVGMGYRFDSGTADSDPGDAHLRFNNASSASATILYIDNEDVVANVVSGFLAVLDSSAQIRIFKSGDTAFWAIFTVTGAPTVGSGYYKVPVTLFQASGAAPFADEDLITVSVTFGSTGGGGGGLSHAQVMARTSLGAGIILAATNETIELQTSGAFSTDAVVSYEDITTTGFVPGAQQTNVATATTVTICAAPGTGTRRIQSIVVRNRDASNTQTIIVKKDVAGTEYLLTASLSLAPDERLEYTADAGFRVFDSAGRERCCGAGAGFDGISAGTLAITDATAVFSNSNGVSFGAAGHTVTAFAPLNITNAASSVLATAIQLSNVNNFSWLLSTAGSAATLSASFQPGVSAISGGTTQVTSGQVVFSNSGNVSFGVNGQTITASVAASSENLIAAGTQTATAGTVVFSNSNGVSFGLSGSSRMTASFATTFLSGISAGTTQATSGVVVFSNAGNVSFGMNGQTVTATASFATTFLSGISAGTTQATSGVVVFSNSNGVSFGLNGGTLTASVGGAAAGSLSAGTTNVALGQVVFSNSNGVSFGLNGSTITATVASSLTGINVSDILNARNANITRLAFGPGGGVLFDLSTAPGQIATIAASALMAISAGASTDSLQSLIFGNANGVSFGLNGSTVTASIATSLTNVNLSAGTTSNNLSAFVFSNSNGVTFGLNGSTITASVNAGGGAAATASAGASSGTFGSIVFTNSNNVGFALSSAGGTVSVRAAASISFSAGTLNNLISNIVFSDANGVSFGLNASTLTASINPSPNRSYIEIIPGERITTVMVASQIHARPLFLPFWVNGNGLNASTIRFIGSFSPTTSRSVVGTSGVALYSFVNSSQLSLHASTTFAVSQTATSATSQFSGIRFLDFTGINSSLSEGRWVLALYISASNSTNTNVLPLSLFGADPFPAVTGRVVGGTTSGADNAFPAWGVYSNTTAAFPASVATTQIQGSVASQLFDLYAIIKEI